MTRLALAGDTQLRTAISRVNRVWLRGLTAAGYAITTGDRPDVLIHHDYREHFATCPVDAASLRVAVRTWDFGPFPRPWVDRIGRDFDRLWVHSEWIRSKAIESGVAGDRVDVIPHGVNASLFTPQGAAAAVGNGFVFLFVGAAVTRKGVDILLRAYAEAFSRTDRVSLILKGHSGDTFYGGQHLTAAIAEFQREPAHPPLYYVDRYLSDEELAALYRAADVGVFPYRAEGFAMPILEAMGCGLPCIVPRFGACLDFCTDDNAFFVEPRRIRFPVRKEFAFNSLDFREQIDAVDFCEIPVGRLTAALRMVYEAGREERRRRGDAAADTVREQWTWECAIARVVRSLSEAGYAP